MEAESDAARVTVSVIVPVRDGGPAFERCLSALIRASPPPAEVIVVVDGASDASAQRAAAAGVRVLELRAVGGPARARNAGARLACGDILFFVDADVIIHSDAVAQVVRAFTEDRDVAAVIGSYDDRPTESNFLSQYKNLFHHYVHQSARVHASTFWTGCGAVRRDVFLEMGGFDEGFRRPSIEDIELGYRLRQAGYRIHLRKTLLAGHAKRWTPLTLLRSDLFDRAIPWAALIRREGKVLDDLNLGWSSRASAVLVWGLIASLAAAFRSAAAAGPALGFAAVLLCVNLPVYRFFYRKRGARFLLGALFWHWLYYAYSGPAFVVGLAMASGVQGSRSPSD